MIYLAPIIAFLLGSIPFGLLIAKTQGINIREHGSGNIGATNVLRIVGKKFGITCFVLDFLKGIAPVIIARTLIFPHAGASNNMENLIVVLTGLCSILGHNYSPWVGFKGGKGIATSAGALAALMPVGLPILGLIWFLLYKTTRYVSVASMGAALSLPILSFSGSLYHGKVADGTWNKPLFYFTLTIGLMAVWKHRSNIKNLINGTEHKFKKKSPESN